MSLTEEAKKARQEYQKQWRQANKEKVKAYNKKFRDENPDKTKAARERYWGKKAKENKLDNV